MRCAGAGCRCFYQSSRFYFLINFGETDPSNNKAPPHLAHHIHHTRGLCSVVDSGCANDNSFRCVLLGRFCVNQYLWLLFLLTFSRQVSSTLYGQAHHHFIATLVRLVVGTSSVGFWWLCEAVTEYWIRWHCYAISLINRIHSDRSVSEKMMCKHQIRRN